MGLRFKSACMHIRVRTAGPSTINRPHELLATLPWYQCPEGRGVLARAHLYAGARYIVGRGLGPECSRRPNPSEYRGPIHDSACGLLSIPLLRRWVNKSLRYARAAG